MTFTDAETGYLASQRLDRLATIQPDGNPRSTMNTSKHRPRSGPAGWAGRVIAAPWRS
jgi:hypothetical protein